MNITIEKKALDFLQKKGEDSVHIYVKLTRS